MVLAGKAGSGEKEVGGDRIVSIPGVDPPRGLRVMRNVEDKMCDTVDISIRYSAVLGAKLFAKLEMTNDSLQTLDQNQVSYS